MIKLMPSSVLVRLVAMFLLVTIGIHACEPVRALHQGDGSAFSAATYQVALASKRQMDLRSIAAAPLPVLPPRQSYRTVSAAPRFEQPAARPNSTGPPARIILARQPAPRAPPLA